MNIDMVKVHNFISLTLSLSRLVIQSRAQISILITGHLINTLPNLEARQMVLLLAKELRKFRAKKEVYVSSSSKVHCEQESSAACPRRGVRKEKLARNKAAVSSRDG